MIYLNKLSAVTSIKAVPKFWSRGGVGSKAGGGLRDGMSADCLSNVI